MTKSTIFLTQAAPRGIFRLFLLTMSILTLSATSTNSSAATAICGVGNATCINLGTCNNGVCTCQTGWGASSLCSYETCGSLLSPTQDVVETLRNEKDTFNLTVPLTCNKAGSASLCSDGWDGPTCSICKSDSVCPSRNGVAQVCRKSPAPFCNQHHSFCKVTEPVLTSLFGEVTASIQRNAANASLYAMIYANDISQFSCQSTGCLQKSVSADLTYAIWDCKKTQCSCAYNSPFCSDDYLRGLMELASGTNVLTCPNLSNDPTSCTLDAAVLRGLFKNGVQLQECVYGECIPEEWTKTNGMVYSGTEQNVTCTYTPPPIASANNNTKTSASIRSVGFSGLVASLALAAFSF